MFVLNLDMPLYFRCECIHVLLTQVSLEYHSFNLHVHLCFADLKILEDPLLQKFLYQTISKNEGFSIVSTTEPGSVLPDLVVSS